MRDSGSNSTRSLALPPIVAPILVLLGVAGMSAASALAPRFGLRPGLVAAEIALAAPAVLLLAVTGRPLSAALALEPPSRRQTLLALAAGATLWLTSLGLFELQYSVWAPPPGYLEAFRRLHEALRPRGPLDAVLSVAAIAIMPALCEEILFRGVVLRALLRPLGAVLASVASAALFGLIHLDFTTGALSLYRVPFAFAIGLALAAVRLRADALLPAVVAHATLNTITFLAAPLADDPSQGLPDPRPWFGVSLFAIGACASAFVTRRLER
jgi:membrane protease YdiL (CAAX protease family)